MMGHAPEMTMVERAAVRATAPWFYPTGPESPEVPPPLGSPGLPPCRDARRRAEIRRGEGPRKARRLAARGY